MHPPMKKEATSRVQRMYTLFKMKDCLVKAGIIQDGEKRDRRRKQKEIP